MDFLWSIALIALSSYVIVSAFGMTREAWASSPGLMPLILGVSLLGMALSLLATSIRKKELKGLRDKARAALAEPETSRRIKRALLLSAAIAVYALLLIPYLHYIAATFLFLVGTLAYFWRQRPLYVVSVSAGVTLFFALAFVYFFETLLP